MPRPAKLRQSCNELTNFTPEQAKALLGGPTPVSLGRFRRLISDMTLDAFEPANPSVPPVVEHATPLATVCAPASTLKSDGAATRSQSTMDSAESVEEPPPPTACVPGSLRDSLRRAAELYELATSFSDMAARKLASIKALVEQDRHGVGAEALMAAYPPDDVNIKRARYNLLNAQHSTTHFLQLRLLSEDVQCVERMRTNLLDQALVLKLRLISDDDDEMRRCAEGRYAMLIQALGGLRANLLCEEIISTWCCELHRQYERLMPFLFNRELNLLEPYVSQSLRAQRIYVPVVARVVDVTPKKPRRKVTLEALISAGGAEFLAAQRQARTQPLSAPPRPSPKSAAGVAADSHTQADPSASSSSSSDSDDDQYGPVAPFKAVAAPAPRTAPKPRRTTRFARQARPEDAPVAPSPRQAAAPHLARHRARHRPAIQGGGGRVTSNAAPAAPLPTPRFGKESLDTLRRLLAKSYREKVTRHEYQKLLREFVVLNGPSGTGYLKRVHQGQGIDGPGASALLNLDGHSHCLWFTRCDGAKVCHNFHFPHGGESRVELPAGMLHDYRNVFVAFAIKEALGSSIE